MYLRQYGFSVLWIRIDFNANLDPAFYLNADPDPAFYLNAEPAPANQTSADPDPAFYLSVDPSGSGSWSEFAGIKNFRASFFKED
jgi:hypothetical protein